jgi:hypothetical protein
VVLGFLALATSAPSSARCGLDVNAIGRGRAPAFETNAEQITPRPPQTTKDMLEMYQRFALDKTDREIAQNKRNIYIFNQF